MQFATVILSAVLATASLVSGEACVVGGPPARVQASEKCCALVCGRSNGNTGYQTICTFPQSNLTFFDDCFDRLTPGDTYVPICIECDEKVNCGLTIN